MAERGTQFQQLGRTPSLSPHPISTPKKNEQKQTNPIPLQISKHLENNPIPPFPAEVPESFHNMLDLCFAVNYKARPSATQLLQHPFLQECFEHGPTHAEERCSHEPEDYSTVAFTSNPSTEATLRYLSYPHPSPPPTPDEASHLCDSKEEAAASAQVPPQTL